MFNVDPTAWHGRSPHTPSVLIVVRFMHASMRNCTNTQCTLGIGLSPHSKLLLHQYSTSADTKQKRHLRNMHMTSHHSHTVESCLLAQSRSKSTNKNRTKKICKKKSVVDIKLWMPTHTQHNINART